MNDRKCGLIVKIKVHNILNEYRINSRYNKHYAYEKALKSSYQLVRYGQRKGTPCIATALSLAFRHLQPTWHGLDHALHATVLILNDTALKGLTTYD